MKIYLPVFLLIILSSCSKRNTDHKELAFFGEFDNTEVTFNFKGTVDSIDFGINFFQYLHPRFLFDTSLVKMGESISFTKKLTLEKPTIARLTVNGKVHEIFLSPAESTSITCQVNPEEIAVIHENKDLHHINQYYAQKSKALGGLNRSAFYGPEALRTDIEIDQIFANFDSMTTVLYGILDKSVSALNLPEWFVEYERKMIYYQDKNIRVGTPTIRQAFKVSDEDDSYPPVTNRAADLNDEDGLLSPDYQDLISGYLQEDLDFMKFREMSRNEKLWRLYEQGRRIENQKIRDIYYCHNYMMLQQMSFDYADSIVNHICQAISTDMQPYIAKLEQKFAAIEHKIAPAFHLKNAEDQLVALSEFRDNIVLLDFWFIGCKACKEELPYDRKLVDTFKDQPFKLIKICTNSDKEQWQKMQDDLSGINLISNEHWDKKLVKTYKISGYPRYVLIDKNGIVIDGWCERPSDPALLDRLQDLLAVRN